ncbi:hypothetical protein [Pseudomonas sp. Leaf58]|nr:hypothetical protein [Pseudomonas sp. Leaf58]
MKDLPFGKHFFQIFHVFAFALRGTLTDQSALLLYLARGAG